MDLLEAVRTYSQSESEQEGRYYGFVSGVITDIGDPKNLGRVRARIDAQGKNDTTNWLLPQWMGGLEGTANVNDAILVGFINGDPNKGFWTWHPQTVTQQRAKEALIFGTTFMGLYNDLVTKFNALKASFNSHVHLGPSTLCTAPGTPWTGSTAAPTAPDNDVDAAKGKASDGSTVAPSANSAIVLSGKTKTR